MQIHKNQFVQSCYYIDGPYIAVRLIVIPVDVVVKIFVGILIYSIVANLMLSETHDFNLIH